MLGCNSLNDPTRPVVSLLVIVTLKRRNRHAKRNAGVSEEIIAEINTHVRGWLTRRVKKQQVPEFQILRVDGNPDSELLCTAARQQLPD